MENRVEEFKALKHKTLSNTYGVYNTFFESTEIAQTHIPYLFPSTCTKEGLVSLAEKEGCDLVIEQLEDYDLVNVLITI